jgi:hypothetical protein
MKLEGGSLNANDTSLTVKNANAVTFIFPLPPTLITIKTLAVMKTKEQLSI